MTVCLDCKSVVKIKCRGRCKNCHWKHRYATDPVFREQQKARARANYLVRGQGNRKKPTKAQSRVWNATWRKRHFEQHGCYRAAKYRPGLEVVWQGQQFVLTSPMFWFDSKRCVMARRMVEHSDPVRLPTSEIKIVGPAPERWAA